MGATGDSVSGQGADLTVELGFAGLRASVGDHIGHFYGSRGDWRRVAVPFLQSGLEASERCVYLRGSETEARELCDCLEAAGVDAEAYIDSGQLTIGQAAAEPAELAQWLQEVLAEVPTKYPLLRWAGDMTWSLAKMPTSAKLMEWETHCNVIEDPTAVFLCQYDLTAFDGSVVMDALRTHPVCIVDRVIHQNPLYREPQEFLRELSSRAVSEA